MQALSAVMQTGVYPVNKRETTKREIIGLVGIGLDRDDEHQRITRSEEFLLVGGSEKTHESMQEVAIRFSESLKRSGKVLRQTPVEEVIDLLHKAAGK
jgi:hypothetical protein